MELKHLLEDLKEAKLNEKEGWEDIISRRSSSFSYSAKCCKPKVRFLLAGLLILLCCILNFHFDASTISLLIAIQAVMTKSLILNIILFNSYFPELFLGGQIQYCFSGSSCWYSNVQMLLCMAG